MNNFLDFWPLGVASVGFVVWLIRLEGRGVSNSREIARLWAQRHDDARVAKEARAEINVMLAEMRADIKTLLARGRE